MICLAGKSSLVDGTAYAAHEDIVFVAVNYRLGALGEDIRNLYHALNQETCKLPLTKFGMQLQASCTMVTVPGQATWASETSSLLCAGCRKTLQHLEEIHTELLWLELMQARRPVLYTVLLALVTQYAYLCHVNELLLLLMLLCLHSVGASCVSAHILTPSSQGLFHRAIVQSGSVFSVSTRMQPADVGKQFVVNLGMCREVVWFTDKPVTMKPSLVILAWLETGLFRM